MIAKFAVAVLACSGLVMGCQRSHTDGAAASKGTAVAETPIKLVTVPEVAQFVSAKSATVLDANDPQTRREKGVVPGAVLLSSYRDYSLSELPAEKGAKLVFYCGGVMCRASDAAAEKAASAGYTDVSVMREGIKGWDKAGQKTDTPRS